MKILIYIHQFPAFGGIETVTRMLAGRFIQDGHSVRIVSFVSRQGTSLLEGLPANCWVQLPSADVDDRKNVCALKRLLDSFVPDVIVFQDSYVHIERCLWEALSCNAQHGQLKIITCEHSSPLYWYFGQPKRPWSFRGCAFRLLKPLYYLRELLRQRARRISLIKNSTYYFTLANAYLPQLATLMGSSWMRKVRVVPNPTETVSEINHEIAEKEKIVLFVGSLKPLKGVDRLIHIWERVSSSFPEWRFVVVGDGSDRKRLESLVVKSKVPNVFFEGLSMDPRVYYKKASVLVMASDFEGWPMVIGEAMEFGCVPIVYDSFAAAYEMIRDGVDGCVIPHFNQGLFISKLELLMSDEVTRGKMARSARTFVRREYGLEAVMARWRDFVGV